MVTSKKTTKIRQSPKLPAETRRHQLLDAAEFLFRKQGFRSTTTADIAKKVELTKGALYFHFKSKREIAFELLKRAAGRAIADLEASVHPGMKLDEIFKILMQAEAEGHLDYYRQSLDFRHEAGKMPEILKFGRKSHNRAIEILARVLGPAYGRTIKQRRQAVIMILCFYDGLMHMKRVGGDDIDINVQTKLFESLFEKTRMSHSK